MWIVTLVAMLATDVQADAANPAVTADCALVGRVTGTVVEAVGLRCPADAPEAETLQRHALAVSAQIETPLDLSQLGSLNQAPVTFTYTGTGWRLTEPALFIRGAAAYPHAAGRRGLNGRCDAQVTLTPNGTAQSQTLACEARESRSDRPRPATLFEPAAEDAIARSRWFVPLGAEAACARFDVRFSAREWIPRWMDAPVADAPDCADAPAAP